MCFWALFAVWAEVVWVVFGLAFVAIGWEPVVDKLLYFLFVVAFEFGECVTHDLGLPVYVLCSVVVPVVFGL